MTHAAELLAWHGRMEHIRRCQQAVAELWKVVGLSTPTTQERDEALRKYRAVVEEGNEC